MRPRIAGSDLTESIALALQFISFTHPADFIRHMVAAWKREESPLAKSAIEQILVNSRMAFLGRRPICQDTGIVNVFLGVGTGVELDAEADLPALVDEGVRRAYCDEANPLRASIVDDPLFLRSNTRDNTPAILHVELVPGTRINVTLSAKGGGSENKARLAALLPSDNVADWVVEQVETMGAGWCPPGILGIGVGGTVEKAMLLAKQALMEPLDMGEVIARGPRSRVETMRHHIYERVNALGIGAQGLGGLTTVLDVKIKTFPTHAASMPVALIPNCAATRHIEFTLDGSGPAHFEAPDIADWPEIVIDRAAQHARRVDLNRLTRDEVESWRLGETLLLSGKLLVARDAAHKRMVEMAARGGALPVPLESRVIYYAGPVEAVGDEVLGPAGPTTATRMDKFMDFVLGSGLLATIGKAERGPAARQTIARYRAASLVAVGGAAYLISKKVESARVVAFEDLGMEAIRELEVREMPVVVAVDQRGASIHEEGPKTWRRNVGASPSVRAI